MQSIALLLRGPGISDINHCTTADFFWRISCYRHHIKVLRCGTSQRSFGGIAIPPLSQPFAMPLQTIDEETTLESPTNHTGRTLYGARANDNASIFSHSTNSTASNLVGPGRVLGNFLSFTGKRLERTLGDMAHRAGFGPDAVFDKICALIRADWKKDGNKGTNISISFFCSPNQHIYYYIQPLYCRNSASSCSNTPSRYFAHMGIVLILIGYSSFVDSTRFHAVMKWADLLRDHDEICLWLFCSQGEVMVKHASALLRVIEAFRSTNDTLSDFQDNVLREASLLIDCHFVGLNFISLNRGKLYMEGENFHVKWERASTLFDEDIKKWCIFLRYLLESLLYVASSPSLCA